MNIKNEQPKMKDTILERLEREDIKPKAKMWFQCTECSVWLLWGATVLFGAISMAIFCSALVTRSRDIYEATHDTPLQFLLTVIPFVWIVVFAAMTVLAVFYFRKTKRGYRYPAAQIIGSSLLFSIIGGTVLHFAGAGVVMDRQLGKQMPMYMSQEKMELRLWQQPREGRLVGNLHIDDEDTPVFKDLANALWTLDIRELREPDRVRLFTGEKVRILGLPATSTDAFYACGVFPWMFEDHMPPKMISAERKDFIDRMYAYKDEKVRLEKLSEAARDGRQMGKCAELKIIKRITDSM